MSQPFCLLHIGAPKTGSTALQHFLSANGSPLAAAGWAYPEVSRRGWGHHDLAFLLGDGYPEWASPQPRALDELVAELAVVARTARRIILSSENFYLFSDPIRTRDALQASGFPPATVRIVAYLRRQDEVHLSWYNQAVKAQGYCGSLAQSIAETSGMWDYAGRLILWTEAFGPGCLTIRPYPAHQSGRDGSEFDVRRDFLELAGIQPDGFAFGAEHANTRLNRDLLEFQRIINQLPLPTAAKRAYHHDLKRLTAASAGSCLFDDSPLLDAAGRQEILARYAAGNRELAMLHFGRRELFDADPPPHETAHSAAPSAHWDGLTAEKVACIIGWLLASNLASKEPE